MNRLHKLIESGQIVDIMVAFVVIEVVVLLFYWRRTTQGVAPRALLLNVGAGGSLMLALGAELKDWGTNTVAAFLVLALIFHVADLIQRWSSG